jgi:hypothetical protein
MIFPIGVFPVCSRLEEDDCWYDRALNASLPITRNAFIQDALPLFAEYPRKITGTPS